MPKQSIWSRLINGDAEATPEERAARIEGLLTFGSSLSGMNDDGMNPMEAFGKANLLSTQAYQGVLDENAKRRDEKGLRAWTDSQRAYTKRTQDREAQMQALYAQYGDNPEMLQREMMKLDAGTGLDMSRKMLELRSMTAAQQKEEAIRAAVANAGGNMQAALPELRRIDPAYAMDVEGKLASLAASQRGPAGKGFSTTPVMGTNAQGLKQNFVINRDTGEQMWIGAPMPQAPKDPNAPWSAMTPDSTQEQMLRRQVAVQAQKDLEDERQGRSKGRVRLQALDRFQALQAAQDTGGWRAVPVIGSIAGATDPQMTEMASISAELTPGMREPGAGATSDFDAQMFQRALPSYKLPKATNDAIIQAIRTRESLADEFLNFKEGYAAQYGHLNGANKIWQQYVDENPIFDTSQPETPTLNAQRIAFTDWFALKSGSATVERPR